MRATRALHMYTAQLTLFTSPNCSLCEVAKAALAEVRKSRTVDYTEINIMTKEQKKWREAYKYDVPVLHIERVFHTYSKPNIVTEPRKLMHRFTAEEVVKIVDETEQGVA